MTETAGSDTAGEARAPWIARLFRRRPLPPPAPPSRVFDIVVNRFSLRAAPIVLLGSFVMPPQGISVSLCWFYTVTGLPCPGCGLTRSLACISHLELYAALRYHPFGVALYALLVALTAASFAGERRRALLRAWLERRALASRSRAVYHGLLAAFLGFGLARLGLALATKRDWFEGI
jgi:Protein of unknown function (DUF2752)